MNKKIDNKDIQLMKEIIKKQWELNDNTLPEWKEKLNYRHWEQAILVEVGEALESAGYKWWKKQEIDIENIKVELIDVLHFFASELYYFKDSIDEIINIFLNKLNSYKRVISFENKNNVEEFKNALLYIVKNESIGITALYLGISMAMLGYKMEDIYKEYMTKNILNKFRQDYGYKTGEYIKLWKKDNKEVEDNIIVFEIAKNIDNLNNFQETLYKKIEEYYLKYCKK